jgi:hypothetical protein
MPQIQLRGMEVQCHIFLPWYYEEIIGYLHTIFFTLEKEPWGSLLTRRLGGSQVSSGCSGKK